MAVPIVTAIVNKLGRTIYRQAGRFISRSTFLRESGQVPRTATEISRRLMAEIGPPIGGGDWVSRVRQSADKFIEFLADENQLG